MFIFPYHLWLELIYAKVFLINQSTGWINLSRKAYYELSQHLVATDTEMRNNVKDVEKEKRVDGMLPLRE